MVWTIEVVQPGQILVAFIDIVFQNIYPYYSSLKMLGSLSFSVRVKSCNKGKCDNSRTSAS